MESKDRELVPWKSSLALAGGSKGCWGAPPVLICHAGLIEAEEAVWGRGWQQWRSLSFPSVKGRGKAITVTEE